MADGVIVIGGDEWNNEWGGCNWKARKSARVPAISNNKRGPWDAIFVTNGEDGRTCNLRFIWGEFHLARPSFFKPQGGYLSHTHTSSKNTHDTLPYTHVVSHTFLHSAGIATFSLPSFIPGDKNKHPPFNANYMCFWFFFFFLQQQTSLP